MGILDIIKSGWGALRGSPGQLAMTPPFLPGDAPNINFTPGKPGLLAMLAQGAMAGGSVNPSGSGPTDAMRAMALGFQGAQDRQRQEFQKQIAVQEMNRKLQNDAILAKARLAEAQKDLAQAEKEKALALKKPATVRDKYTEAFGITGDHDMAMEYALGIKKTPAAEKVEITPEAARAGGFAVPTQQQPIRIPFFDPVTGQDTGMGDIQMTQIPTNLKVPVSAGTMAGQNLNAMRNMQQRQTPSVTVRGTRQVVGKDGKPTLAIVQSDGTIKDTGVKPYVQPTRQRGAGGGGSSEVTARQQKTRTFQVEQGKNASFRKIMADIEKNPDDVERHVRQARDAQQAYEDAIESNGGTISDEAHNAAMTAVEQMVRERAAQVKGEQPVGDTPDASDKILGGILGSRRPRGTAATTQKPAVDPLGIRK